MDQYTHLPMIYDRLMQDVDYNSWAKYLVDIIGIHNTSVNNILELGCGSGNITKHLLDMGYEVVGIDISEQMLELAHEKLKDYEDKVILMEQDIRELDFEIYEIDCILAVNDTFNYILEDDEVRDIFNFIYSHLKETGCFIFDISSPYKLKTTLGNNTYGESMEDLVYLWENYFDDEHKELTMDVNFFIKNEEKDTYMRFEETHIQKAHDPLKLTRFLEDIGFKNINVYSDFDISPGYNNECQRVFISCNK